MTESKLSQKEQIALISSKQRKEPTDYKKVNKTRRQRGYSFEYDIVQAFNNHASGQWHAKRLGGSSTGLPDIVVTNNEKSICYAIECKSGDTNKLYVPRDQIERCIDITNKFLSVYRIRYIVLSFKFKANKKKGRKLQYRIIPIENIIIGDIKGISYDIREDLISLHFNSGKVEPHSKRYSPITSIDNFVNWSPVQ